MAVDFTRYLDVPVESIEAPKPIPIGHYFATIKGWKGAEVDYKQGAGKTPVVEMTFAITSADEDVDANLLPPGYQGRTVTRNYTLNDPDQAGQYQLRKLAEDTCKLAVKGLALSDVLREIKGQEVKLYIDHRPGQEEGQFFPQVKKVLPVD